MKGTSPRAVVGKLVLLVAKRFWQKCMGLEAVEETSFFYFSLLTIGTKRTSFVPLSLHHPFQYSYLKIA
jgi:hypothetical protein